MKKYIILVASIVFILSISAVSAGLLDGLFDGSNTPINSNEKTEFKIYGYAPMPVEKQLDIIKKKQSNLILLKKSLLILTTTKQETG